LHNALTKTQRRQRLGRRVRTYVRRIADNRVSAVDAHLLPFTRWGVSGAADSARVLRTPHMGTRPTLDYACAVPSRLAAHR